MKVEVRNDDINQALRVLKKKLQREGVFREMRDKTAFEKPSDRSRRKKDEASRRAIKKARRAVN
jgi:small subunit ribosomal protein S21